MNRHTLQKLREQENEEGEEEKKEEVTQLIEQQFNISGGQQIIVQKGANPVIHIHNDNDNDNDNENDGPLRPAQGKLSSPQVDGNGGLTVEDEEMLLPMFKGNRENLRRFFAEVQRAEPKQIHNKINVWIGDGRIRKEFKMKNFWRVLYYMNFYPYSYETLNKHVTR